MASGKSNYLAQKLLDLEFGLGAFTFPATGYLALFTTAQTPANTGTEVSGSNYSRVGVALSSAQWARVAQTVSNLNLQLFPVFSGNVPTVLSVGVYDAATGGNLLWYADLAPAYQKSFTAGDQAVYPSGAVTITES
ncbi:MAG: phage tail fiber protein [Ilumatobacteraceae bacterium]